MNETILRLFFRFPNACNFNRQNTLEKTHVGFNLHTLPARARRELGERRLPRFLNCISIARLPQTQCAFN